MIRTGRSEQELNDRVNKEIYVPIFLIDIPKLFNFLFVEGFTCENLVIRFSDEFGVGEKVYYNVSFPALREFMEKRILEIVKIRFIKYVTWESITITQSKIIFRNVKKETFDFFNHDLIIPRFG